MGTDTPTAQEGTKTKVPLSLTWSASLTLGPKSPSPGPNENRQYCPSPTYCPGSRQSLLCPFASGQHNHEQPLRCLALAFVESLPPGKSALR